MKLIAPEAVRPFVKKGKKNDAADAAALCAAASRPDVKFVPAKSLEQQGVLALHSARSLLVNQQTMLANAMRSLATEFGLTVPKGISKLGVLMELVDADATFPQKALQAVRGLLTNAARWLKGSRHLKRRLSLTRGTMKPRAAWPRSPASVRSPRS